MKAYINVLQSIFKPKAERNECEAETKRKRKSREKQRAEKDVLPRDATKQNRRRNRKRTR
jgi:hypothetical protein